MENSMNNVKNNANSIKVTDIRTARRLMSRIIKQYQSGEIKDTYAKTLTYLIQNFINIIKTQKGLPDLQDENHDIENTDILSESKPQAVKDT